MNPGDSSSLCLECGLCCNGVIFADGQLQPEDDAELLRSLGLKFALNQKSKIKNQKFLQPCACFDGCRCHIYSERPKYCREFECLLLKNVNSGRTNTAAALRIIHNARQRVEKVKRLLRDLGNTEEGLALSKRFRKVKRRVESSALDEDSAEKFGDLTLAVHDLNVLLSEAFYPAP
jgi:Fe-S-cluster containining protein